MPHGGQTKFLRLLWTTDHVLLAIGCLTPRSGVQIPVLETSYDKKWSVCQLLASKSRESPMMEIKSKYHPPWLMLQTHVHLILCIGSIIFCYFSIGGDISFVLALASCSFSYQIQNRLVFFLSASSIFV